MTLHSQLQSSKDRKVGINVSPTGNSIVKSCIVVKRDGSYNKYCTSEKDDDACLEQNHHKEPRDVSLHHRFHTRNSSSGGGAK